MELVEYFLEKIMAPVLVAFLTSIIITNKKKEEEKEKKSEKN